MKTVLAEKEQFIVDTSGQRVGVVLDLASYEQLLEAAEDNLDLRAYRVAKSYVSDEIAHGKYATLADYRAKRARKSK